MKKCGIVMVVVGLLLAFCSGVQAVDMVWVTVGDPCNVDDTHGDGYGGVDYVYRIGKYEVTNEQYCELLNAVADVCDPYNLYNTDMNDTVYGGIKRSGSLGSYSYGPKDGDPNWLNRPVNYVCSYDTLRFANWMHNGQPADLQDTTTTEDGAYDMSLGASVVRKVGAKIFLPSEDEWYKAAYYKGDSINAGYWDYPTQSDADPNSEIPPGTDPNGSANYYDGNYVDPNYYTTEVGAYTFKPSDGAYGTFDQGGNVWEWNDGALTSGSYRGFRGGTFQINSPVSEISSSYRFLLASPNSEGEGVGFRVASFGPVVISPNGGEEFIVGHTETIGWETAGDINDVSIEYSANNGQDWNDINTVPNTGSYNWTVPEVTSNQCLVRINDANDANIYDVSDDVFIIYQCQLLSPANLDNDCDVDFGDFAIWAKDWLRNGNPFDPEYTEDPVGMVFASISDPNFAGLMSKYETTNAQYCQFLNDALTSGDISVSGNDAIGANGSNGGTDYIGEVYYDGDGTGLTICGATNGGAARINYSGGVFSVDSGFENHPVTHVSWYGATAFSDYYGYRLPTEAEWLDVADFDGSYTYGCGTTIDPSKANYCDSTHPDGTRTVGDFGSYGYGMADMAGNVWEWTRTDSGGSFVICGGSWRMPSSGCTVLSRDSDIPSYSGSVSGFRIVLDLD